MKESKEVEFTIACLKIVDETEENMKNDTDIEIIRQKYLGCTEKIEKEVISHNVVADFGLTLMLTNMKLVNENSPKEMIILRIDCLRKGLSNFKLKMENDGKKWLQSWHETKPNNPMHLNCVQLPASTYYIIYNVGSLGINIYIYLFQMQNVL